MIKKEITSIIQSRKSVYPKEFNGEIIKDKDIIQLLENANHAPSHKMTQPWRFKIFCQNSKKKLLNEIMKVTDFSESKKQNIENRFEKTSHIISICMKKNIEIVPEWEEIAATAMAVQNIWISCSKSKIGGYWSTPKYSRKLRKFLELDKDEICLGFFYLGIHQSERKKRLRDSVVDKIQWFK